MKEFKFQLDTEKNVLTEESTRGYFSRVGFAVFALGVGSTVGAYATVWILKTLLGYFLPNWNENELLVDVLNNVISVVAIYVFGLIPCRMILAGLPKAVPIRERTPIKNIFGWFLVAFCFVNIGSNISSFIIQLVEGITKSPTQNPVEQMVDGPSLWVSALFLVVVAPILEELVFRKMFCDRLLPLGEGYAIFCSAAIFGLLHGNLYQFAYAFLIGCVLGYVYIKTGKLRYSIAYHMLINLFGSIVPTLILRMVDMERLNEMLVQMSEGVLPQLQYTDPLFIGIVLLALWGSFTMALYIGGMVVLIYSISKKRISFEKGIIQPPREGRVANIFCTWGVACAIAYLAITFVLSILPA